MTQAKDIIERAFRKVGITGIGRELKPQQLSEGLIALNSMIHAWALAGVDTDHTDLGYTDTFPLASKFEEGTVYLLANRISPDYEIPPMFDADDWFRKFQAAYIEIDDVVLPSALKILPSQRTRRY